MAMLSQSIPITALGCPAGVCRGLQRSPARASWKAIATGFAAGALMMFGVAILARGAAVPSASQRSTEQAVAAAKWAAYVQGQTPREIPREWRYEINGVKLDGMFRKKR